MLSAAANVDPQFPNGCPSGFTLQQAYFSNTTDQGQYVSPSTPGAQAAQGSFACLNAQLQTPVTVVENTCPSVTPGEWLAIAAAGAVFLLLPGLLKLLALPVVVIGSVFADQQYQAQVQSDGSVKCVITAASSW